MKISFMGAAGEVTGSQHLFEINGKKVLVDCGLFQGRREETYRKNHHPLYEPSELDAIVISHAHLDHIGLLPLMASKGFTGTVFATETTVDLADPMLRDSAHIQEKDLEFVNRLHAKKGLPAFNLLYDLKDTEQILKQMNGKNLREPFQVVPGMTVTYLEAGHVLGSAQVLIELQEKGRRLRVGFTGDLGRANRPILKNPEQLADLDVLMMESTYGNREHDPISETGKELLEVIRSTVQRGGKLIIPAFALERTQELLFELAKLKAQNELPANLPVFVDSPLAKKCTDIFIEHTETYDDETCALIKKGINPFEFEGLNFTRSVEDSKALNDHKIPMIILAASGMMEAGRILHHLRNNIENPKNTILIVSFQAEHTLGRRIADRVREVNILGERFQVNARIKILNSFSGHAGRTDLINCVKKAKENSPRLKKVFLVHGEPEAAMALKETLDSWKTLEVSYPQRGESVEL